MRSSNGATLAASRQAPCLLLVSTDHIADAVVKLIERLASWTESADP